MAEASEPLRPPAEREGAPRLRGGSPWTLESHHRSAAPSDRRVCDGQLSLSQLTRRLNLAVVMRLALLPNRLPVTWIPTT